MSAYETSSLAVSVFSLVVSTVVLLLLVKQIRLLSHQVEDSRRALNFSTAQAEAENIRLKQRATMDFLAGTMSKLQEIYDSMPPAGSSRQLQYLEDASIRDSSAFISVRNYLNYLEDLSVAVNMAIFDKDVVYRVVGGRMYRAWENYKGWIDREREVLNQTLYSELESCVEEIRLIRNFPAIR